MTQPNTCRVCGSQISLRQTWDFLGFHWGECSTCDTTQKILTPESYRALNPTYDPGMFIHSVNSVDELRSELLVDEKRSFLGKFAGEDLSGKRFLDIGCGLGGFLFAAQELGMETEGFEPSALHYSLLEKICPGRFNVVNDYFEPTKCTKKFDVIMLSHVIEHILLPGSFLSDVVSKLEPGGILIVVTPNNESVEAILTGRRWLMYKPIDHVTMIGPKAAKALLPKGCVVESLTSDEYRGEFMVHAASALKSLISANAPSGISTSNSEPRKQVSAASIPAWIKAVFQAVSFPFWVWGRISNRLACMTVVYKRT